MKKWFQFLIAILFLLISSTITVHNGVPDGTILIEILYGFVRIIPFIIALLIDKLFYKKVKQIISMFIFPSAIVIIEYLLSLSPIATSFSVGPTNFGNLSLMQLVSLTGVWGASFVICWFSTIVNLLWENDFEIKKKCICNYCFYHDSIGGLFFRRFTFICF